MSRNNNFEITAPLSKFYHGPYGRLFPELGGWSPTGTQQGDEELLEELASEMAEFKFDHDIGKLAQNQSAALSLLRDHASANPAGYTYLGQFVDHDITFDPASSLMRRNDPNGLHNHRTPRLDLDSLYGGGPKKSPHLYDRDDDAYFLIDFTADDEYSLAVEYHANASEPLKLPPVYPDLPRNSQGRAVIGDPRNDENSIVSQLHLVFLLAHNELVRRAENKGCSQIEKFERARTTLRWLYQHIVWHDFLRRITVQSVHSQALEMCDTNRRASWKSGYSDIYDWKTSPFIPVEFSVAAYRMGHSMVRPFYKPNSIIEPDPQRLIPVFDSKAPDNSLKGGDTIRSLNCIQWNWFFDMEPPRDSKEFPQRAAKLDTLISSALFDLPSDGTGPKNLAYRNLLRGLRFNLPAGSAIAKKLGITPKVDVSNKAYDALWYYILKEAELGNGDRLGEVGSVILCATFSGLLLGDPNSYFVQAPTWHPDADDLLAPGDNQYGGTSVDDAGRSVWSASSLVQLSGMHNSAIGLKIGHPQLP